MRDNGDGDNGESHTILVLPVFEKMHSKDLMRNRVSGSTKLQIRSYKYRCHCKRLTGNGERGMMVLGGISMHFA